MLVQVLVLVTAPSAWRWPEAECRRHSSCGHGRGSAVPWGLAVAPQAVQAEALHDLASAEAADHRLASVVVVDPRVAVVVVDPRVVVVVGDHRLASGEAGGRQGVVVPA